jgi:hypothetical protein
MNSTNESPQKKSRPKNFSDTPRLVFEQQQNESARAFAGFSTYLNLGPERSLAAVAQKLSKSEQLIKRWSAKYDWPSRVQAQAAYLANVERETTEELARVNAAQWLKRREEHRQEEWAIRSELITAGRKVLKRFTDDGKGATLGDVARALDLASKLGRLASGLATDHTELTGPDGGPIQIELTAALNKIYGPAVDVDEVPVAPAQLAERAA